jgi:anthranilate synthase/aminodeoxychorismate synthase-like glutamine amidotransferase
MILLIDNYDSFTYNLAHLFGELGADVVVRRNDELSADEAETLSPSFLVVSPGPGRPEEAGATPEILRRLSVRVPVLGVCLGHQAIVQSFGGADGEVMAVRHRELPVDGVQFHPESVLTPHGRDLAKNFLEQ